MKRIKEFFCRLLGHRPIRFGKYLEVCGRCDGLFYKKIVEIRSSRYGEAYVYVVERII